jgi:hypothetical protein
MSLNFRPQFLEVLNDRAVDRSTEVSMLVSNDPGFVANAIVDILLRTRIVRIYGQEWG